MKKLAIGVDIGGTNTSFGAVDQSGKVYFTGSFPTTGHPSFEAYASTIARTVLETVRRIDDAEIAGIGIGAPNAVRETGHIEQAANLAWKGSLPIAELIRKYTGIDNVRLDNDAKAATVGEMLYGGGRGIDNFAVITLGTGIGSGFVVNGRLVTGHDGQAGELGHSTVVPGGRTCGCGRKGCLETYASAVGIKRTAFEVLSDTLPAEAALSPLSAIAYNEMTSKMISDAAKQGDPVALRIFEQTGEMLGRSLANLTTVLSPEVIFLFGGLARAGELILDPTRRSMERNMLENFKRDMPRLALSAIDGDNAAILGASALVWQTVG